MEQKFLIIDGNSLVNRAFYALPFLSNSKGQFTGAVYGFANMLTKILSEEKPTHIVVAFDYSRKTFRNEIYAEYKGTRKPMPEELRPQIVLLKEMLDVMGITRIEREGIEADDIIGSLSKNVPFKTIILSGDKDVFQLIDSTTDVIFTKKGITETEVVTTENIKTIFGYYPQNVTDLKALMGDSSDNIPGIAGVGPKTALDLIEKYQDLDGIYQNLSSVKGLLLEKLSSSKEIAYMSKRLATIKTDFTFDHFDIENCKVIFPFKKEVFSYFEDLEFNSLIKKTEIFENAPVKEKKTKEELLEFKTLQDIQDFKKLVLQQKSLCFVLQDKLQFSCQNNKTYFLTTELNFFSSPLELDEVILAFKDIFENAEISKTTYDLKTQMHILSKFDIALNGEIFDISIADYLINAGVKYETAPVNAGLMADKENQSKKQLKELDLLDLYYNIELPLTYVLFDMEQAGFKIDESSLQELSEKYKQELAEITKQIYALTETEFNVNSPKQLAEVLFNKLGLKSYLNKKLSTNIEVLNEISNQHPVIPLVIRYRKLFKLSSTYIESYKTIVSKTGNIIHTVFNQTLTSTGRLSSSEPNLQNIPIRDDEGKNLRKLFISKYENGVLVSADYNQIELRLLAAFSGDENMVESYRQGKDIHTKTASQIFAIPENMITANMRREAKAVNFGIVYGISDFGLATNIGISRKKAKDYIEKYFANYPKVKIYMDENIELAKKDGMIRTLFKRIRKVPEIAASNYQLRQFGERVAMNMPLQGSASDIIKKAMIKTWEKMKHLNLQSKLILQIHDELIIDTHPDEVEVVKKLLKECMEHVVTLQVDLPVEVSSGKTWFDCK